jgi:DNA-binding NtrC family response regulator
MDALVAYDWPSNVRELQNVIERSLILCTGDVLSVEETLGDVAATPRPQPVSLKQDLESVERSNIVRTLEEADWKIKGPGNAADRLGMKPSTLRSRMARLGIQRPSP